VDLLTLESHRDHPHGLDDGAFTALFTEEAPVVFAFHGYARNVHELIYRRPNPQRFHVRGYNEEGTTTTPFDMLVQNEMSRYHLAILALRYAARLRSHAGPLIDKYDERLAAHRAYIREYDEDLPEVRAWRWSQTPAAAQYDRAAQVAGSSADSPSVRTTGATGDRRGGGARMKKDGAPDIGGKEAQSNA
jgi:phosphoketolase